MPQNRTYNGLQAILGGLFLVGRSLRSRFRCCSCSLRSCAIPLLSSLRSASSTRRSSLRSYASTRRSSLRSYALVCGRATHRLASRSASPAAIAATSAALPRLRTVSRASRTSQCSPAAARSPAAIAATSRAGLRRK